MPWSPLSPLGPTQAGLLGRQGSPGSPLLPVSPLSPLQATSPGWHGAAAAVPLRFTTVGLLGAFDLMFIFAERAPVAPGFGAKRTVIVQLDPTGTLPPQSLEPTKKSSASVSEKVTPCTISRAVPGLDDPDERVYAGDLHVLV